MKILAIETSCDDTGIAILEVSKPPKRSPNFNVLSNVVASQIEIHKKYGGVYPAMAKREHQRNLLPTLTRALKQAGFLVPNSKNKTINLKTIKKILEREPELYKKLIPSLQKYERPDVDLIAVTNGPGLEPCLWVGVNFAKALSSFWNIPIVPVSHIESHILINLLENPSIKFPAIALVVSGGHTQLILMGGVGKYKILGETKDDAAGECFDKCAKLLGLGYPGGPIISKLAENIKPQGTLPRPMIGTKDYDFSFSGLKTAVLYSWQKQNKKDLPAQAGMAAEVQQAVIDVLIKKTIKAVKNFNTESLILGGGVSANHELRKQFQNKLKKESPNTKFFVPKPNLSTDNALMVAMTGFYHQKNTKARQKIKADGNLRIS
jgi:N6-L-threonylcarbamoyladenine synthase